MENNLKFFAEYSVKSKAVVKLSDGSIAKTKITGKDGDCIDFIFDSPVAVNTLVLLEKGDAIMEFEILIKSPADAAEAEDGFVSIYTQDKVGALRYCAFNEELTDTLRLRINKTKEGTFTLKDLDILDVHHTREDFRITAYAVVKSMLDANRIDPAHLNVITDFILFGAVVFDEEGHLSYSDFEIDGETLTGKEAMQRVIDNIRAAQGENKPRLYINILGPDGDVETKEQKHNVVFKEHAETLCAEIKDMLGSFDVDGIYFDYEYPYKASGWRAYSKFLIQLEEEIGEKKIGIAIGPWGGSISGKAQDAVDFYEMMTYDDFDSDGYHATFQTSVYGVDFLNRKHYDLQKSALGVPYYGRPIDRSAVWTDYSEAAESLGRFSNLDTRPIEVTLLENGEEIPKTIDTPRYMNSYQMIYDKTAFAYDLGVGGMMIWNYACDARADTGLSLFEAMQESIDARNG